MKSALTVGIVFKGKDSVSPAARKASTSMRKLGNTAQRTFGYLGKKAGSMATLTGAILQAKVLSRGMAGLEYGTRAVVESYADLDQAVTNAGAKFGPAYYKGTKGAKDMMTTVRKLGASTEFTSVQAAEGLDVLAMAGLEAKSALAALPTTLDLATAGQVDMAQASDLATGALGSFGLSKAPDKIAGNLTRVADALATTATSSKTDMTSLMETLNMSGPAVHALGGTVETWAALTGALGDVNIKGSKAGTALRNMYVRLAAPASKARKEIAGLGLNIKDSHGNMKDMVTILNELQDKLGDQSNIAKSRVMNALFGKRAISAGQALISDKVLTRAEELRKKILNTSGSMKELAGEMRKGLGIKMAKLKSVAMEKGFQLFAKLMGGKGGSIEDSIDQITKKLSKWDVTELADTLRTVFGYVKSILGFIWDHRQAISALLIGSKVGGWATGIGKNALGAATGAELAKRTAARSAAVAATTLAPGATGALAAIPAVSTGPASAGAVLAAAPVATIAALAAAAAGGAVVGAVIWNYIDEANSKASRNSQDLNALTSKGMVGADKLTVEEAQKKKQDIAIQMRRLKEDSSVLGYTQDEFDALKYGREAIKALDAHISKIKQDSIDNALNTNTNQSESNGMGQASFMEALKNRKSVIKVNINSPVEGLTADVSEEEYFTYEGPKVTEQSIGAR